MWCFLPPDVFASAARASENKQEVVATALSRDERIQKCDEHGPRPSLSVIHPRARVLRLGMWGALRRAPRRVPASACSLARVSCKPRGESLGESLGALARAGAPVAVGARARAVLGGAARPCLRLGLLWRHQQESAPDLSISAIMR